MKHPNKEMTKYRLFTKTNRKQTSHTGHRIQHHVNVNIDIDTDSCQQINANGGKTFVNRLLGI